MESRQFDLDLHLDVSPDAVRSFWTDLPDTLEARAPDVEPHRVVTLDRTADGRELHTWWRGPEGEEFEMRETLHLEPDGSWTFDVQPVMGVRIYESFEVEDDGDGGSRLHVHVDMLGEGSEGDRAIPLLESTLRQSVERLAEVCERHHRNE